LLWGFVGTRYARFRSFLFKPREVIDYAKSLLRRSPAHYLGHNPLGSVAIWLLLALGISTGATGVLLFQDIGGDAVEELHELLANAMLAVVVIHIAGVLVSSVLHRENLVRSMITGFKSGKPDEGIRRSYRWLGVIILASVVAFWVGYPATGVVTQGADTAHAHQQHGG
ncbi:MAG TPA: cytochrome b/b6 domain-containing protein, partial [Gallionellaceae bacterium]|nr:cytochrome b/b6 domain-containing protein [Gallionellaceae bacterium]